MNSTEQSGTKRSTQASHPITVAVVGRGLVGTENGMDRLGDKLELIAEGLAAADPADPRALAEIHGLLAELAEAAAAGEEDLAAVVARRSVDLAAKVEAIVLRETADAMGALEGVKEGVRELLSLVGDAEQAPESAAPAEQASKPEEPAGEGEEDLREPGIAESDVSLVREFLAEAADHLETAERALLELESNPGASEPVSAIFRSFHTIKGVAGFLGLRQISALAHEAENLLDLARRGELQLTGGIVDVVLAALDAMRELLRDLDGAVSASRPLATLPSLPGLIRRIRAAAEGRGKEERGTPAEAAKPSSPRADEGAGREHPRGGETVTEATVKVATNRLDSLVNMVGELLIAQSMLQQDGAALAAGDARFARSLAHLGKITRELQDLSMSMRMVPIQGVFQKMARLARDVARKAEKQVEFVIEGGETELDRNLVEAIADPLVHMVRNAVDHGIEPPADRVAAGKPPAGRVELRAWHQAGHIVVQLSDDGRGLCRERILKKAQEAGIVKEGAELSDAEVYALIFHAGLSTAEKVTDISGRGVGMDVVKRNVESLRGRIEITSTPGRGSTFTVRLPLTLAMIDGMVVRVGSARFIVPITSIEQSLRPRAEQLSTVQGRGEMCMVRGALLPLYRLYELFSIPDACEDPVSALVLLLQADDRRCCLLVDELLGQQQVVVKSLGKWIGDVQGVSGGGIMGDGTVSLILDVHGLMELAAHVQREACRAEEAAA